jgi:hypothetical protein
VGAKIERSNSKVTGNILLQAAEEKSWDRLPQAKFFSGENTMSHFFNTK